MIQTSNLDPSQVPRWHELQIQILPQASFVQVLFHFQVYFQVMRRSKFIIKLLFAYDSLVNLHLLLRLLHQMILKLYFKCFSRFHFKPRFTTWFTKLNPSPHWVKTEAEFFTANTASKVVLFLRFVSEDLNLPMATTTPIYEDNKSCITIVHACLPTDRVNQEDS